MGLGTFIRSLLPREERFQELFAQDTQNLVRAGEIFVTIASSRDLEERRLEQVGLKTVEHKGDELTLRIFEALNSTFITPFDREDIRQIAVDIDDVLDFLESIAQFLVLFEIQETPENLARFAEILLELCHQIDAMTGLIWNLANSPEIQQRMVRVSELENQADALYLSSLGELFADNGRDAIEIMKWKEIYQGLEDACDKCKDFTHVLGNVVIKNA